MEHKETIYKLTRDYLYENFEDVTTLYEFDHDDTTLLYERLLRIVSSDELIEYRDVIWSCIKDFYGRIGQIYVLFKGTQEIIINATVNRAILTMVYYLMEHEQEIYQASKEKNLLLLDKRIVEATKKLFLIQIP
jgi:hypothetical protein